jgi:hypothetical protein
MNHHNPNAHRDAELLLATPRGQYILSQALTVAIKQMETVEPPLREPSNIADMRLLRNELFPIFAITERATADWRALQRRERSDNV